MAAFILHTDVRSYSNLKVYAASLAKVPPIRFFAVGAAWSIPSKKLLKHRRFLFAQSDFDAEAEALCFDLSTITQYAYPTKGSL